MLEQRAGRAPRRRGAADNAQHGAGGMHGHRKRCDTLPLLGRRDLIIRGLDALRERAHAAHGLDRRALTQDRAHRSIGKPAGVRIAQFVCKDYTGETHHKLVGEGV